MVLETYLRYRGRRYDRQRQDALSQPRKIKPPPPEERPGRPQKPLDKEQLGDLIDRLAKPKRGKVVESGEHLALQASRQEMVKQKAIQARDVEATFARLSAPKAARGYDPTPGEKVCLMYNQHAGRSVNLERLANMAKPKKRTGAAESWALTSISGKESVGLLPPIQKTSGKAASAPATARELAKEGDEPEGSVRDTLPEVPRKPEPPYREPGEDPPKPLTLPKLDTTKSEKADREEEAPENLPADASPTGSQASPARPSPTGAASPSSRAAGAPSAASPRSAEANAAEDVPALPNEAEPETAAEQTEAVAAEVSATEAEAESQQEQPYPSGPEPLAPERPPKTVVEEDPGESSPVGIRASSTSAEAPSEEPFIASLTGQTDSTAQVEQSAPERPQKPPVEEDPGDSSPMGILARASTSESASASEEPFNASAMGLTDSTMQALALRSMESDGFIEEDAAEAGSSWPEPAPRQRNGSQETERAPNASQDNELVHF